MSEKRKFHLTDIAGVTTGRLLKPEGFGGIQDVVIFMNRWDDCYTTQTIEGANNCSAELKRQLPWLSDLDCSTMNRANYQEIVAGWITKYGEWHEIEPLPLDDRKPATDELDLFKRINSTAKVYTVNTKGEILPNLNKPKNDPPSYN